ncbi:MAG: PDZ domain-containing protein [Oscillospiraceae bacterium]|jgi:carboxyl-terminal processing protease|nr:PDZ domain-containing protein [Oscillospiraceae bacterium]
MQTQTTPNTRKEPVRILLGTSILLIVVSIIATITVTMSIATSIFGNLMEDFVQRSSTTKVIQDLDEIVRNNYWGEIDSINHITQIETGYIRGIGDPRSRYLTPSEYKAYQARILGNETGAGMLTQYDPASGRLLVTRVFPSSPAAKSGLKAGDILVEIADTQVNSFNSTELQAKLQGSTLSSVKVTYSREKKENTVTVMLGFANPTVLTEVLENNVGYVRIFAFYEKTAEELTRALSSLEKKNVMALVFDVRGVFEGTAAYAAAALDPLCPVPKGESGALATLIAKDDKVLRTFSSDAAQINWPIAVVTDGRTLGAAELFACDLRDFQKGTLVGEKTAGVDTALQDFELKDDGGGILLTVAKIRPYVSAGWADGLAPDVAASLTDENKAKGALLPLAEDAQLQAALALFGASTAGADEE